MARRTNTRRRGRKRRRSHPRLARLLSGLLVVAVLAAAVGVGWLLLAYPKSAGPGDGGVVRLRLDRGASIDEVARDLAAGGAVARPATFAIYARLVGADERLREGAVMLTDDLTPQQVLAHVAKGFGPAWVRVAIPEGFTRFDIAKRLDTWSVCEEDAFVRASGSGDLAARLGLDRATTLEGYLFPATYELKKGTSPEKVIRQMVRVWRRRVMPLVEEHAAGLAVLKRDFGWGLHEVMILASIVEKEAAVPEERPIIAGVFLNRLRSPEFQPKRLQADPTVAYGCLVEPDLAPCSEFDGRISGAMLRDQGNPYNTYRLEGLPAGPIANPGAASIRAVLDPTDHEFLYFVARGEGRHHFSTTLDEHVQAVERRRAASGSP